MAKRTDLIWAAMFAHYINQRHDGRMGRGVPPLDPELIKYAMQWADLVTTTYLDVIWGKANG